MLDVTKIAMESIFFINLGIQTSLILDYEIAYNSQHIGQKHNNDKNIFFDIAPFNLSVSFTFLYNNHMLLKLRYQLVSSHSTF